MKKIWLDAGHGGKDPGAVGHGLAEKDITLSLALRCEKTLKTYFVADVAQTRRHDVFTSLEERTNEANRFGADLFYSFHVNAGGASGYEDYVYNGPLQKETTAIRTITHHHVYKGALKAHQVPNRGMKRANFHVLRETTMPAILTENLFIDNRSDASDLKVPAFLYALADAHAYGIALALALPVRKRAEKGVLYVVQAGAFRDPDGAKIRAEVLRKAGFDAFVEKQGGFYRVQTGAFRSKDNADTLAAQLDEQGFEVLVKREG